MVDLMLQAGGEQAVQLLFVLVSLFVQPLHPDARRPFVTANEGMWRSFEPELRRRLAEVWIGAHVIAP